MSTLQFKRINISLELSTEGGYAEELRQKTKNDFQQWLKPKPHKGFSVYINSLAYNFPVLAQSCRLLRSHFLGYAL